MLFLTNLLPTGFAEMRARLTSGEVLLGKTFAEMLVKVARAQGGGPPCPEAVGSNVFLYIDLRMLRTLRDANTERSTPRA